MGDHDQSRRVDQEDQEVGQEAATGLVRIHPPTWGRGQTMAGMEANETSSAGRHQVVYLPRPTDGDLALQTQSATVAMVLLKLSRAVGYRVDRRFPSSARLRR